MIRPVYIYGGVLIASLAVAWMRYTAEPTADLTDKILLLQGDAEDITQVTWRDEDEHAIIDRRSDDHGSFLWVSYTKTVEVTPTPDLPEEEDVPAEEGEDAPAEEPVVEEEVEVETREESQAFKAGEKGDGLLADFSPLIAIRKLEGVDAGKLESIGLSDPQGEMTVVRKGRTATFDVGGEAFGTRDIYLRDTSDGAIYLVDDETLRPLRYARTRLPDRTLFSHERPAVARAILADASGASIEATQKNASDSDSAAWVRSSSPEEDDSQLETWMGKALMLKSTSTAAEGEEPEGLELSFRLTVISGSGEQETLEVFQAADGAWWGSSEHTRSLVKLLKGVTGDLSDDIPTIIRGDGSGQ
jgi:hypothetical protein